LEVQLVLFLPHWQIEAILFLLNHLVELWKEHQQDKPAQVNQEQWKIFLEL
jgi:hypothetical protein